MTTYLVSAYYTEKELLEFLNRNSGVHMSIEVMPDEHDFEPEKEPDQPAAIYTPKRGPRPPRPTIKRKRSSKVINAILDALKNGSGEISELKNALVHAGMSAASLSTGLAILQKAGTVKREGGGVYSLVKDAAEAAQ